MMYEIAKTLRFVATLLAGLVVLGVQPAFAQADLGPTLAKIQRNGAVYVGHREGSTPFSYIQAGTEGEIPQGFSWDICMRVVDSIREKLGRPDIKAVPVPMVVTTRMMMVKAGLADMECGVTTNTLARQRQVGFSNTFFVSEIRLMVKKDSGIASLRDLNGKNITFTSGTTADRLIKSTILARNMTASYIAGRDNAYAMELLASGQAHAYVADDGVLFGQRSQQKDPSQFIVLNEGLSAEPYGFVLPKDDPQFKALVDEMLVKLMRSGEFETIYNKWFLGPIPPSNVVLDVPMSDKLRALIKSPNDRPAPPQ